MRKRTGTKLLDTGSGITVYIRRQKDGAVMATLTDEPRPTLWGIGADEESARRELEARVAALRERMRNGWWRSNGV
jgi:hypothetical protein